MIDLYEVIDQVAALLKKRGRLTYRALKLQFQLDEEHLEALKEELIKGQQIAVDEDGSVLVFAGDGDTASARISQPRQPQSPSTYPPQHLGERIETVRPKR